MSRRGEDEVYHVQHGVETRTDRERATNRETGTRTEDEETEQEQPSADADGDLDDEQHKALLARLGAKKEAKEAGGHDL